MTISMAKTDKGSFPADFADPADFIADKNSFLRFILGAKGANRQKFFPAYFIDAADLLQIKILSALICAICGSTGFTKQILNPISINEYIF